MGLCETEKAQYLENTPNHLALVKDPLTVIGVSVLLITLFKLL